jgi:hypothetical protein
MRKKPLLNHPWWRRAEHGREDLCGGEGDCAETGGQYRCGLISDELSGWRFKADARLRLEFHKTSPGIYEKYPIVA